jgi:hypothetical protein
VMQSLMKLMSIFICEYVIQNLSFSHVQ